MSLRPEVTPVAAGLVASLNRPGGNLTGTTIMGLQMGSKRLDIVRQLVPTATKVTMLVNPRFPTVPDEGQPAPHLPRFRTLVERSVQETLTYYAFPDIHWQKIRTNNPLERIMREIRRRTRVVGAFPDGQSCLNLAAARLRYIAGSAWSTKRYMNMRPLYQPQVVQTGAVA